MNAKQLMRRFGKAALVCPPPRARFVDPSRQNIAAPFGQNKNDPCMLMLYRGFFVALDSVLADG